MNSLIINEFNNEQRREIVNSRQRFHFWREARDQQRGLRGSMVWQTVKSTDYLARSHYDKQGRRKQISLGPRSPETEAIKSAFERSRDQAKARFRDIDVALKRQAAINRAVGLGRVPLISARIIRTMNEIGAPGSGIRVVGTNALYAYEAAAGVMVDPELTTTADIDLLFDSRAALRFIVSEDIPDRSLLAALRDVDKSFTHSGHAYRATNSEGYMVDLIKPRRNPPWKADVVKLGSDNADLVAAEIEGLVWLENSPAFEAIAIDERGFPLRIVAADPRVWAVHKHWISQWIDRDPIKRRRDAGQAEAAGAIVAHYLLNCHSSRTNC